MPSPNAIIPIKSDSTQPLKPGQDFRTSSAYIDAINSGNAVLADRIARGVAPNTSGSSPTGATPPISSITDRPQQPVQDVYNSGGGIMINDKVYQQGAPVSAYSGEQISSGADGYRNNMNGMISSATDLSNNLDKQYQETTAAQLQAMLEQMAPRTSEDKIREAEDAAAKREENKWAPLISEAQRQKEKGFAQATIGAGERGGFMSSQMAGTAALVPTVGQDFSGAGGKLNEIESDYDNNISQLKAKSLEAIAAAKAAARAAIEGRDDDSYKRAVQLYQLAQTSNQAAVELAAKKADLVATYQKLNQARVDYDTSKIDQIAKVGGTVPDEMKAELDGLYGEGWSDLYIESSKQQAEAQSESETVDRMKKITDLLKSYPAGKKLTIGNSEYETIGSSSDTQTFKELDKAGNATMITIDKRTGEVINTAKVMGAGKSSSGGGGGGGGSSGKEVYFTRPVNGKTQYFYGNKNDYQNAQSLSPEEYRKGVSSAANTMPQEEVNYNDTMTYVQSYKEQGLSEAEAKKQYAKDFGVYDNDAEIAIGDVYGGGDNWFTEWIYGR